MPGYIAVSGAVAGLGYVLGKSTALDSEWATKVATGDLFPKATYLMLLATYPVDANTTMAALAPVEVTGSGYARQAVPWAPVNAGTRSVANLDIVVFGPFGDPAGLGQPVAGAALVTRLVGAQGLCLMAWQLSPTVTTLQNQTLMVPLGSISMALTVA